MDGDTFAFILFALGLGLGTLLGGATYALELRRMARFLHERHERSNARLTVNAAAPGLTDLADAVNAQLDRTDEARIATMRHQQEFQRDLSALSHDIRTPLMGAKGYLQLAREETDTDARNQRLIAATERIDGTTALLDQLFSYAKASDPDLTLDLEPVAVRPLIEQVLIGHYPEFEERGWEPSVRFEQDDFSVEADRDALARIFENLVTNALRYGASTLSVTQTAGNGSQQTPAVIAFSNRVANPNAIDADRLFERFYQADPARGGHGTGLGLSVAAKLAEAMNMRISARLSGDMLTIELRVPIGDRLLLAYAVGTCQK